MNKDYTQQQLDKAIAVMESANAANFHMDWFQHRVDASFASTIEELHACDNTACFEGYITLTDDYKAWLLLHEQDDQVKWLNDYLGISERDARYLVWGNISNKNNQVYCNFYNKLWNEITPNDVIVKLKEFKVKYANQ